MLCLDASMAGKIVGNHSTTECNRMANLLAMDASSSQSSSMLWIKCVRCMQGPAVNLMACCSIEIKCVGPQKAGMELQRISASFE